jgi:hypothetical protein
VSVESAFAGIGLIIVDRGTVGVASAKGCMEDIVREIRWW